MRTRYLFHLFTLLALVLLLYPFDFQNPVTEKINTAERVQSSNGITFRRNGMIRSRNPATKLYKTLLDAPGLTLELWIKSGKKMQYGPARIISFSKNKLLRNFTLGQDGTGLILRLRTDTSTLNGLPAIRMGRAIVFGKVQHIVVTYNRKSTKVFIGGIKKYDSAIINGSFSNWDPDYFLVLGNELTGRRSWRGTIFKAAIYDKAISESEVTSLFDAGWTPDHDTAPIASSSVFVSYLNEDGNTFSNQNPGGIKLDLFAPTVIRSTNKIFLRPPFEDFYLNYRTLKDLIINVLAFIPFGYLFSLYLIKNRPASLKNMVMIMGGSFLFTLSVEFLQYYLPSRSSSGTDIIYNTVGAFIGLCCYLAAGKGAVITVLKKNKKDII